MSQNFFKKVIGQENAETARPSVPIADPVRQPEPTMPATSTSHAPAPSRQSPAATRNVLSSDVEIKGTVKFTNDLVVDGRIEGEISSEGNLTVGENARLKAEIKTATVVVYGKVHGNITAADRVDLKASAEVIGDIKAKTLSIESGAIFVGKSTVGTPTQAPVQTPAKPAQPAATPAPQGGTKPTATLDLPKQGTFIGTNP